MLNHKWMRAGVVSLAVSLVVGCTSQGHVQSSTARQSANAASQGSKAKELEVVSHIQFIELRGHSQFLSAERVTQEVTAVIQALTPQGAQALVKRVVSVNNQLEDFALLNAETRKADGRRLPVDEQNISRQRGVVSTGTAISWQDFDLIQVNFPDLQVGDQIAFTTRTTTKQAALPGGLWTQASVEPTQPIQHFAWTIEAPQSLHLHVETPLLNTQHSVSNGQERWSTEYGPSTAIPAEPNWANTSKRVPRVLASTYPRLEDLGDAFARVMRDKMSPTPEVQALAQKLTQGLNSDHDKARAITDWVRSHIKYVAVFLGTGGFVPHDVASILINGYGDCKDHTLLLHSLLAAANIEAAPALISTGSDYVLPPAAISAFNHVITYLPGLKLFVDSTARDIPFGALPFEDSDKPVLVGLKSGTQRMHTPAFTAEQNRLVVNTHWTIDADGRAQVTMKAQGWGQSATAMQDRLQDIPPAANAIAVSKILGQAGWQGRGFLRYDPIQRQQQTQAFDAEATITNLLPDPSGGQLNPSLQMTQDALSIVRNMGDFQTPSRRFDKLCTPKSVRETFTFQFDPKYKLVKVPQDFQRDIPGRMHFEAHYEQQGNTITGWRAFVRTQAHHVCTTEDYEREAPVYREVAQHLRTGLLFTQ